MVEGGVRRGSAGIGGGGRERDIISYAVTTRMTPALRWAATRAIFVPSENIEAKAMCLLC